MVQQHLHSPEDWGAWLDLIEAHPGQEAELSAQLSLHLLEAERSAAEVCADWLQPSAPTPLPSAAPPVATAAPPPASRARWALGGAAAVAAAALLSLRLPTPSAPEGPPAEGQPRGPAPEVARAAPLDFGAVRIEADGRAVGRAVVGVGLRPAVPAEASLLLRWAPPAGVQGAYYTFTDGVPTELLPFPPGELRLSGPLPEVLVVVAAPAGAEGLAGLPERVGAGRGATSALGAAELLVIDVMQGTLGDTALGEAP